MEDIITVKKILKSWEKDFVQKWSRKPAKEDILAAPESIQVAYKEYNSLKRRNSHVLPPKGNPIDSQGEKQRTKTENQENTNSNVDACEQHNSNDTWGKQFDKPQTKESNNNIEESKTPESKKRHTSSYLSTLGEKLFKSSQKLSSISSPHESKANLGWKRNSFLAPKPSHSERSVRPDLSSELQPFLDESDKTGGQKDCNEDNVQTRNPEKQIENVDALKNASADLDCVIDSKIFGINSKFTSTSIKRKEEQNDVLLYPKYNVGAKPKKILYNMTPSNISASDETILENDSHKSDISPKIQTKNDTLESKRKWVESSDIETDTCVNKQNLRSNNTPPLRRRMRQAQQRVSVEEEEVNWEDSEATSFAVKTEASDAGKQTSTFDFDQEDDVPVIPKGRKRKLNNIKSHNSNSFDEKDSNGAVDDDSGIDAVPKSKRRKMSQSVHNTEMESLPPPDDVESMELSGGHNSIRPRKSSSNIKSKPVSNDNFVRLNMKVKSYRRRGGGRTGSQMKRFQWKQKMKARSASYGDACFKCGQSGHWANKCPGQSGNPKTDVEPVLDEDFPSLQEAAMMARGIKDSGAKEKSETKKVEKQKKKYEETADESNTAVEQVMEVDDELEVESSIVRTAPERIEAPPPMEPLFTAQNESKHSKILKDGLKKFGYENFRPGQQRAITRILSGLSTLLVLSTGGGKSLCYQLPAYLYAQRSKCVTLVISPLVSLMEDQITGLPAGVRGACLHTNMTTAQREGVIAAVKEGKVHFLLVSPEAVAGGGMTLLSNSSSFPPIAFVCIDEAHCLSEWSHNFRPSYLRLCKVLREKFGVRNFLGLTATATKSTAADVAKHLMIEDLEKAVIKGPPVPKNLELSVSRDEDRDEALLGLLQGKRFSSCESIIIYCTRRQQTDRIATMIRTCLKDNTAEDWPEKNPQKKGKRKEYAYWDAESYHAGQTAAMRKRVQNAFMSGRLRVVVATVAFGMGLDKSNVRGVIHFNLPKSFESYVQEIGRAGRDGKLSQCHVFLEPNGEDLCELRKHTYSNTVDYKTLKKFVQKVFVPCRCLDVQKLHQEAMKEQENNEASIEVQTEECSRTTKRICPGHERAFGIEDMVNSLDVKEEGLSTLFCYLELHSSEWLTCLPSVYSTCALQCYGGPAQLQALSKKCPPLAVAIARAKKDGKTFASANQISFNVIDVSDAMGWDSGPVKRELKTLQWNFEAEGPRKSGVVVEFSGLSFHYRTPGDFDDDEVDDVIQFLHERIQKQEKSELKMLKYLYSTLKSVSHKNYWMCAEEVDQTKNLKLRDILRDYFEEQIFVKEFLDKEESEEDNLPMPQFHMGQLVSDIRQFINLYSKEHRLTGRAIARIFHGIASPCYPAQTWGRVYRFWRSHMNVDFNELIKIATKELLEFR